MKRQALALILTGAVAMNVAACSSTGERKHHKSRETTATTAEETTTTTAEPTAQTTQAPDPTTPPQTTVQMVGNTEFELSDEYDFIVPFTYSCTAHSTPDSWEDTFYTFEMGFTDQDGNVICDPIYNTASNLTNSNLYVVGQFDENGRMKYGLISFDGSVATELKYDGYYELPGKSHDAPGNIYMSDYEDGILTVDCYDSELNTMIESREITINPDNFTYFTDDVMVSVVRIFNEDRAVVRLFEASWGPIGTYLIDTENGDILAGSEDWNNPIITDTMFIVNSYGEDPVIYDLDGNDITGDYIAVADVNNDKVAFFTADRVEVVDNEGNITATASLGDFYEVEASNCKILVGTMEGIEVYDQDLNLLRTVPGYDLSFGITVDDYNEFVDADVVFLDFDTDQLVNLMNGETANYNDELTYTGDEGLLFADDDWGTFYTIYDFGLNNITAGVGDAELITDRVTGELYIVEVNDSGITKLYHVNGTDVDMIYQYDAPVDVRSCEVVDGTLIASTGSAYDTQAEDIILDQDGNVIFECQWLG